MNTGVQSNLSVSNARPRVGLVVGELRGVGGLNGSVRRHIKLMSEVIDVVPISLETSADERDWCGRVERSERDDYRCYRIFTSDFRIDKVIGLTDFSKHSHLGHLEKIARDEQLRALHVFGAFEMRAFIAAIAAVRLDIPLIVSFRGVDLELRIFGSYLAHLQAALQTANQIVCVNGAAQQLVERMLRPDCSVSVIHNHVDPVDFSGAPIELNLPRPIIGCIGEFRRIMGLDYLLQAFSKITRETKASLLLIGPFRPMEAMYYTNLIDNLEHSQRVFRVGALEHRQVLAYLNECDVLAFPSISDGSPNKVLEGMLASRAIVAADVGGIPELVRDGVDGVLIPPRDGEQLANAITMLLNDPERRRVLGETARERVVAEFSSARARREWLECYRTAGVC